MYCAPFHYFAPPSIDEVVGLLDEYGDDASLLAGGQSLVPMMGLRLAVPEVLIDLGSLLRDTPHVDGDELVIPAGTRHSDILRDPVVNRAAPLLPRATHYIGNVRVRNRGTVGGSLVHADPAAEWPCVSAALGGSVRLYSTRGARVVPLRDFFGSFLTTAKEPDEVLTEVRFPVLKAGTGHGFAEMSRRANDFAVVESAAVVSLSGGVVTHISLSLGGVAERPVVLAPEEEANVVGGPPSEEALGELVDVVVERLSPHDDVHGTAVFRRHLARHLGRRSLVAAVEAAQRSTT